MDRRTEIAGELSYLADLGLREMYMDSRKPGVPAPGTPVRKGGDAVPTDVLARPIIPTNFESLETLASFAAGCPRCKLSASRTHMVMGQGNPRADLLFIGEAPGADEDAQGLAFVGRAGQLLTKIIEAINLKRDDVFIANVLKCRPPENRNPEADEVDACRGYLAEQIRLISPKVIVTLGTFATQAILQTDLSIGKLRGRFHRMGEIDVMPTYHPAYLLRSPERKRDVWEDMKLVRERLNGE